MDESTASTCRSPTSGQSRNGNSIRLANECQSRTATSPQPRVGMDSRSSPATTAISEDRDCAYSTHSKSWPKRLLDPARLADLLLQGPAFRARLVDLGAQSPQALPLGQEEEVRRFQRQAGEDRDRRRFPGQPAVDGMVVAHDLPEGVGERDPESVDPQPEASAGVPQLGLQAVRQGLVGLQGVAQWPDVGDHQTGSAFATVDLVAHAAASALDVIAVLVARGDRDLRPAVRAA